MNIKTLLCSLILLLPCTLFAKVGRAPEAELGINLANLFSGTPELQGGYFINRYVGIVGGAGYVYRPVTGFDKDYDGGNLESLNGLYWKVGLKGRWVDSRSTHLVPWFQIMFIGSHYDEKGTETFTDKTSHQQQSRSYHNTGFVTGYAAAIGLDFVMSRHFCFRLGGQFAHSGDIKRSSSNIFQPGFGPNPEEMAPTFILGFTYTMGNKQPHPLFKKHS